MSITEKVTNRILAVVLGFTFIYMVLLLTYSFITAFTARAEQSEVAIIVYTELAKKVKEGKAFSSSKRFTLNAGESVSVLFNNKSDKTVVMVVAEVDVEGNVDIDIYDNVTVESSGNKWDIRNLNLGSSYMTNVEVEDGGTYTGGKLVHQTIGFGGKKNFAVGSLSEVGEGVYIPPNNNILLKITNTTSSAVKISVRFIFYEGG